VRGTSRREEGLAPIEAAGIEAVLADPAQPSTVLDLVGDVTVVAWMLGSAQGSDAELAAIHGPRLDRMMEKLVETPVRGFVYEAGGSVDPILLARGQEAVDAAAETWNIPLGTLLVDPNDHATWADPFEVWLESATNAVLGIASET
jgi:hypothetical protein